jgi:hypothetical protein
MNRPLLISACAGLVLSAAPAIAALSQAVVSAPGGFIQAAAYPSTSGGGFVVGGDLTASMGTPADFEEHAFSGNSSTSADAAYSSGPVSNSCAGATALGFFRGSATNTCPNNTFFATAGVHGGFKDRFTVSHPSHAGQAGYILVRITVRGSFIATGFAGAAGISLGHYKNEQELSVNSFFDRGNSDPISTDRQRISWALASFGQPESRSVDGFYTVAVPITFGQPFTFGVYAFIRASQRSSSGVGGLSSGTADFSAQGVEWGGITSILLANGTPVSGASVSSDSGINWEPPLGPPCDPDVNQDGNVDQDDVAYLINVVGGGPNPTNVDPDFNHDGNVDQDDVAVIINVIAGGTCP